MLFNPAFLPGLLGAASGGGEEPPPGDAWPTAGLSWVLDPDDAAHRVTRTDGVSTFLGKMADPLDATLYADNGDNATCPVLETKNGRGVATFNGSNRALFMTAELIARFGSFDAPRTVHFVRYLPATDNGFYQGVIGIFPASGTNLRHTYDFDPTGHLSFSVTDAAWGGGGSVATDDPSAYARGVPLLFSVRVNADLSVDLFLDGVKLADDGDTTLAGGISTNGMMGAIGMNRFDSMDGSYLEGSLGAILWYGLAQSDSELAVMAAVKAARYA